MISTTRRRSGLSDGGFTLVELIVTMLVASILVAIAVPTYTNQIRSSRRTDARSALLDLAGREERFLSTSTAYSMLQKDLGYASSGTAAITSLPVGAGYYQVTVTVPDPAQAATPNSFIATATAVGKQASDTQCASFSVNQLGQHTSLDSSGADSTAACWNGN